MIQPPTYSEIPTVTVILPIYNEAEFITPCLEAILQGDYPPDKIEILVVDGGSTDATRAIVEQIQAEHANVLLLDNPKRLQAHGLNQGIKHAQGEIILRVDGHTLIGTDYISQCVATLKAMANENVVNVGGLMRPEGKTAVGWAVAAATSSPFGIPTAFHHSTRPQFVDTVYLGAWPREVFTTIGEFNPEVNINEDYELNYRIRMAGGKIYLNPAIASRYFCRQSFYALWRQYYRYGVQKVQMLRRFPTALRPRQLVAPIFVVALVGLPILGIVWSGFLWPWLLLIMAYLIAAGIAASRTRHASLGLVIGAFAIIHVAWGVGFWRGLIRALRPSNPNTFS